MTCREAYKKYKHLDRLLSDPEMLPDNPENRILVDLWQVVKEQAEKDKEVPCPST